MSELATALSREEEGQTGAAKARAAVRRLWEVDSLRGVAIVMMVIFHLMWDLKALAEQYIVLHRGFWFYFQRTTATLFITLVGVSLVLSYNRARPRFSRARDLYLKFLKRGAQIFGVGVGIAVAVWLAGVGQIHFGVLHLIGFSVAIAYPFLRYRFLNLALGVGLIGLSEYFQTLHVDHLGLVWLGIEPPNYVFLDYFPVAPWFGVVLIGIFLGNTLYPGGRRRFALPDLGRFFPFNLLQFLGRHSLLIYVIHQPILIALLLLTGVIDPRVFGF